MKPGFFKQLCEIAGKENVRTDEPMKQHTTFRIGGAAVSEKHSGFVVNLGGASARDVLAVADEVARVVEEKTGYRLEKEIRVVR